MSDGSASTDDDLPWASPEIRLDYEAALGRFILAFNHVDYFLARLLQAALLAHGRRDLIELCVVYGYRDKIIALELLKLSVDAKYFKDVSFADLKQIGANRNTVAHGHFDQNPIGGDFVIRSVRVSKPKSVPKISIEILDQWTATADSLRDSLRYAEAYYDFRTVVLPPPD